MQAKSHSLRSAAVKPMLAALSAGIFLAAAGTVSADNGPTQTGQICMQKVYGTPVNNSIKVNCTANDIRISRAISVSPTTCTRGARFDLTATFETIVTANARYDAGFFFRIDGGANARGDGNSAAGSCSLSALAIPPPPNPPSLNLDADTCGDLNAGTYSLSFTIPNVLCQDSDGDGFLNLPNCTSWHSNQGTTCSIPNAFDFDPDTKSKCVCDDKFQVPVRVELASISVDKSASPTQVPEPGGTVTYTVQMTNDATVESVTLTSIVDSPYGDLISASNPNVTDNTCPSLLNQVLAPGASATCSFKALASGNAGQRVTDLVRVCGDQSGSTQPVCGTDTADVDITDIYAAPTLVKTPLSTANCQIDATYQVVVSNNSAVDALTVVGLTDDKFGDVTTVHAAQNGLGAVVSTTCSLPQPAIAPLGNYSCTFVGRIVSATCTLNHVNTMTGNVVDDDGVSTSPSNSASVVVTTTP